MAADSTPQGVLAALALLPERITQGDHIVCQSRTPQGLGQAFGSGLVGGLVGGHSQQIHIGAGIPVAPGQGAKQQDFF